jgi:hypothetical protein
VPDYWERVHNRWSASIEAAEANQTDNSAQLRHKRFQRIRMPLPCAQITMTGMRGVGKDLLYDAITSRIGESYKYRGRTDNPEDWRVKTGKDKRRSDMYIIPGQRDSTGQEQGFTAMFLDGAYPKGVIHVVCWGYDWIWEDSYRRAVAGRLQKELQQKGAKLNLETLRAQNLKEESDFFEIICDMLTKAWKPPAPSDFWLIVAVTKCDLYWSKMDEVERYYLPDPDSGNTNGFQSALSNLVTDLRPGRLSKLAILPVSSVSTVFDFSKSTKFPFQTEIMATPSMNFSDVQRQALLNRIQITIGEFNAKQ